MFDMFNMEEFEPEEADPDLFRRRRSGSIEVRCSLCLTGVLYIALYVGHSVGSPPTGSISSLLADPLVLDQ